jgi:hypothetical protein
MADFCKKCWHETWGPNDKEVDYNDFKGLCDPGEVTLQICEGCGPGYFDHEGALVPDEVQVIQHPAGIDGAQMAHNIMELEHEEELERAEQESGYRSGKGE